MIAVARLAILAGIAGLVPEIATALPISVVVLLCQLTVGAWFWLLHGG